MKKTMNAVLLSSLFFVGYASAKVTVEEAIRQSQQIIPPKGLNANNYHISTTDVTEPISDNANNLKYVGSGNMRLPNTGYYVVDTSASGNRTTSNIFVPSLSGVYYGTSGTSSNSAVGVRVVNGVIEGYGNQSTPRILSIYRLK
ncbi:hypothetical protein AB6D15_23915 [Vibrio splendidus]